MTRIAFIAALASAVNAADWWTTGTSTCKDFTAGIGAAANNCSYFGCLGKSLADLDATSEADKALTAKCDAAGTICGKATDFA